MNTDRGMLMIQMNRTGMNENQNAGVAERCKRMVMEKSFHPGKGSGITAKCKIAWELGVLQQRLRGTEHGTDESTDDVDAERSSEGNRIKL